MSRWLYDQAMYRFDMPEPSYWEATAGADRPAAGPLQGEESCDVAVIGAGYTGLSAAYHLARDSSLDVRVLEAGHLGWGASGRNGGFCTPGGAALGAEKMVRRYGLEAARDYYRSQVAAIELVRDLIVDENIEAAMQGDGEIAIACSASGWERLKSEAEFKFRMLGIDTKVLTRDAFAERYFDSPLQHGASLTRPTFGLHPLRFLLGLAEAATRRGAVLHAHSEVEEWTRSDGLHRLRTAGGTLCARHVIVATNGFTPEHLNRAFRGRPLPLISAIVVTRPMTAEELARHRWQTELPSITSLNLLNYFRLLPDGRFLFGGRGSANGSVESAAGNFDRLVRRLHEVFPAWREIDIEYRWHGLICMTRRLTPAIGRLRDDPTVLYGFGFHGNGVNTATWTGQHLARWLTEGSDTVDRPAWLPRVMAGMPASFPLPGLRLGYIKGALAWRRHLDRKGARAKLKN